MKNFKCLMRIIRGLIVGSFTQGKSEIIYPALSCPLASEYGRNELLHGEWTAGAHLVSLVGPQPRGT